MDSKESQESPDSEQSVENTEESTTSQSVTQKHIFKKAPERKGKGRQTTISFGDIE